jgi:hypothetical protein
MIVQEGFYAVNFDLWVLLVKYEIPSIFISSKPISETRFNKTEFVCYINDEKSIKPARSFIFIVTPALYKREKMKGPEYKLIMDENNKIDISLDNIKKNECIVNIEESIQKYHSIETYIGVLFEKDNTTKYQKKIKGVRRVPVKDEIEFDIQEDEEPEKKKKNKKNPNIEFDIQDEVQYEEDEEEKLEIIPVKKRSNRKKPKLNVNPHGKTKKNVSNI